MFYAIQAVPAPGLFNPGVKSNNRLCNLLIHSGYLMKQRVMMLELFYKNINFYNIFFYYPINFQNVKTA
uniref:Uncharacterized protein n=1 Tax=uncultured Desulfobacterium sp. TaxID=201089 RepID=E1YIZ2_9BACT|nr:unknown protein [uncultured Desulfobacterium sp.]